MHYLCSMINGYTTFMCGIIAGIYLLQFLGYAFDRSPKAPFRRAFGWMAGVSLIIVIIEEVLVRIAPDPSRYLAAIGFFDILGIPMYWLEVTCIFDQDTEVWPWKKRLRQLAMLEVPILMLAIVSLFYPIPVMMPVLTSLLLVCILIFMTYAIHRLMRYERSLNEQQKKHEAHHITWIWKLFAVYAVLGGSYQLWYTDLAQWLYPGWIACLIAHGYFIDRQKPINTTSMYQQQQQQYAKAQEQAIKEISDITSQLKKRVDMDTSIATFKVMHPTFEQDLQQTTDVHLTKRDFYLCILIYEGKKSPEVARSLAISQASVDVARCRLRVKLGLDKGAHLGEAIRQCIDHTGDAATED